MLQIEKARTVFRGDRDPLADYIDLMTELLTRQGARGFRREVFRAVETEGYLKPGLPGSTIRIDELQEIFRNAYERFGRAESSVFNRIVQLDMNNPRVVRFLRGQSADLVVGADADTKRAIRQVMASAAIEGRRPEEMVTRIARVVGLTDRDALAVENMERGLVKQGVSRGTARRRANEYSRRLLEARALTIARTEVVRAREAAKQELWEQAADAGIIRRSDVWRVWVTAEDEKVDDDLCSPLHGARARLGGQFHRGGVTAHLPPLHPNCRCEVRLDTTNLTIVTKHAGPGPHPSGSSQDVHGNREGLPKSVAIALGKLPKSDLELISHVNFIKSTKNIGPLWYDPSDQNIYYTGDDPAFEAVVHEVGHAIDHALGWLSGSKAFEAVARQYKQIPKKYHVRGAPKFSEVWASGYAAIYANWTPMWWPGDDSDLATVIKQARIHRSQIEKHAAPIHPGTGTDQSVHGEDRRFGVGRQRASQFVHPTSGEKLTRTQIGDVYEGLLIAKGLLGPLAKHSDAVWAAAGRGKRTNPVDLLVGPFAIEVKTVNAEAANWKATIKRHELDRKYARAKELEKFPATLIQVVNQARRRVEVHWFPNVFASKSVRRREPDWSYNFSVDEFEEILERVSG